MLGVYKITKAKKNDYCQRCQRGIKTAYIVAVDWKTYGIFCKRCAELEELELKPTRTFGSRSPIKTRTEIENILDRMDYCREIKKEISERYMPTNMFNDEEN